MKLVLNKLFMINVYELYATICWDIRKYSLRYINGVYNQEKALTTLVNWKQIVDICIGLLILLRGSFYTDVSSVSFSVSTSRPSSIMYNIGDIHTDNRSRDYHCVTNKPVLSTMKTQPLIPMMRSSVYWFRILN